MEDLVYLDRSPASVHSKTLWPERLVLGLKENAPPKDSATATTSTTAAAVVCSRRPGMLQTSYSAASRPVEIQLTG